MKSGRLKMRDHRNLRLQNCSRGARTRGSRRSRRPQPAQGATLGRSLGPCHPPASPSPAAGSRPRGCRRPAGTPSSPVRSRRRSAGGARPGQRCSAPARERRPPRCKCVVRQKQHAAAAAFAALSQHRPGQEAPMKMWVHSACTTAGRCLLGTSALLVSRLTAASSTPGSAASASSTAPEQVEQVMPPTWMCSVAASPEPSGEHAKPLSSIASASWAWTGGSVGSKRVGRRRRSPPWQSAAGPHGSVASRSRVHSAGMPQPGHSAVLRHPQLTLAPHRLRQLHTRPWLPPASWTPWRGARLAAPPAPTPPPPSRRSRSCRRLGSGRGGWPGRRPPPPRCPQTRRPPASRRRRRVPQCAVHCTPPAEKAGAVRECAIGGPVPSALPAPQRRRSAYPQHQRAGSAHSQRSGLA